MLALLVRKIFFPLVVSLNGSPSLESLMEGSAEGFALLEENGAIAHVNPAGKTLLGAGPEGIGEFLDLVDIRDREIVEAAFASALAPEGRAAEVTFRPLAADVRVAARIRREGDAAGNAWLILNFREAAPPARPAAAGGTRPAPGGGMDQDSKGRLLDMLLENLPVMACRIDSNGFFLGSRGRALRHQGLVDDEVVGRNALEGWPGCRPFLEKAMKGEAVHFEWEVGQEAERRVQEIWLLPDPASGGVVGFGVDVTERKRTEEELSKSEAFSRRIVESSRDCIMVLDSEGKLLSISYSGRKLMEMDDPEAFLGRAWQEFWRGDERGKAEGALRAALRTGVGMFQGYCPSVTGRPKWWDVILTPILNPSWEPDRLLAVCRDITEHKRFEETLRRSKDQLEAVLRAISDSVVVADPMGRVIFANDAAARLLGLDSAGNLPNMSLREMAAGFEAFDERGAAVSWPSPPDPVPDRAQPDRERSRVLRLRSRESGAERWLVVNCAAVRDGEGRASLNITTAYDFTERKKAEDALRHSEDQLRQSQKMEAVGRLAGGVAHDFNNLLTAINGYSELLMKSMRESDPLQSTVGEIRRAGERAASLTRQLLTFSRRQAMASRILDLNQVVGEIRQMLGRLIGEDIQLSTVCDPGLAKIDIDPGQMEQVILNLALNARDAMPTGGRLTIETGNARLEPGEPGAYFPIDSGDYVRLTVSDTGTGMSEDVKAHLFEPFFTTKPPGQGTGLGLSTVYGIVKTAGGNISVSSETGKGTSFAVYLPAASPARAEAAPAKAAERKPGTGRETILLVEDEDMVRRLIGQVLLTHGYHVLEAGSGLAALEVAGRHHGSIDLLLTDVVMGGMSGRQLAEKMLASLPGLKVLYMSGYTDDEILRHGIFQNQTAFLGKPFSPGVLARKLREVLDGVDSDVLARTP